MNIYGPFFTAQELGVLNAPQDVQANMFMLVRFGLHPLRLKYGPIRVTSGYRSPQRNAQVGGSETSQHVTGAAVDIDFVNHDNRQVFEELRTWWPGQLFYYTHRGHIHLASPTVELYQENRLYALVMDK